MCIDQPVSSVLPATTSLNHNVPPQQVYNITPLPTQLTPDGHHLLCRSRLHWGGRAQERLPPCKPHRRLPPTLPRLPIAACRSHRCAAVHHLGPAKSDSGRAPAGEAAPLGLLGAAQRGDLAQLRRALAACPGSPDSIRDGDGCTALHLACAQGSTEVAHLLIRAGASVWCKTDAGRKPLHFAAGGGHVEVMKLLLEASCSCTWAGASPFSKVRGCAH